MRSSSSISLRLGAASLFLAAATASTGCDGLAWMLAGMDASGVGADVAIDEPPPPPPVSGGTLLVTSDDALAVAADSEGDRVFIVDLATNTILRDVFLAPGDEPGRVAEGPDGFVYVALRSGGAVAAIHLATGSITRRDVCPAPRGIAYDATTGLVHVACAGGELVSLSADLGPQPARSLRLDRDLRDVVVEGDKLLVSRFRSAEVLAVSASGEVSYRIAPGTYISASKRYFEPAVAWRMIPVNGGAAMIHQRSFAGDIPTGPSSIGGTYYGGACDLSVVHAAVTVFDANASVRLTYTSMGAIGNLTLPVDMAVSSEGNVAVVGAGAGMVVETSMGTVLTEDGLVKCSGDGVGPTMKVRHVDSPVAVAYTKSGRLLIQGRQVLLSEVGEDSSILSQVWFPEERRLHSGHNLFHTAANGAISPVACASCHPEGRDDGRVWHFTALGPRRTQSMLGGVLDTAPLHWDGDMPGLTELMGEVFVNRMGGAAPDANKVGAVAEWMQSLPPVPPSAAVDASAAKRGAALFMSPEVGCASCHSGPMLTNNATIDVGTGKALQVPSLVGIGGRAPFMHNGCATTLRARFEPACGGGDAHGKTSQLTKAEIDDLVTYLETL